MIATTPIRTVRTRQCKTLVNGILQTLHIAGAPVPTPDLVALHGEGRANPRASVWTALNWLHRTGRVRKKTKLHPGGGCVTWWEPI